MMKAALIGGSMFLFYLWLREQRKKQPTINYVGKVPFGYNALTVPPIGIFINAEQQGNEALLKHELIHWQQYQRMGLLPYYGSYLFDLAKYGYDKHPMEMEARENENDFCKANYTSCVRNGTAKTVFNPDFR